MSSLPANLKRIGLKAIEKVMTSVFRHSKADYSVVRGGAWPKFKLMQPFMHALITCKYEKDRMKNSGENVMMSFSPL